MPNENDDQSMHPKRIVIFTGNYNAVADGVALTLNRLVRYLERKGNSVLVVGPSAPNPPFQHQGTFYPVPSISLPFSNRKEYRLAIPFSLSTRRKVIDFKPHLVHVATPDLLGRIALKFAKRFKVPLVASFHTHFASYMEYYGLGAIEDRVWRYLKSFYDACLHVYVPSQSMVDVLKAHHITKGVRLWERGVETAHFSPEKRDEAWRAQHGIAEDEVVVSFVSRLVWEKGLDVFAAVVKRLEAEGVPHKSLIVGDGPALDELKMMLPNTIFTGYQSGNDLTLAYASSDVFLFPSETETFGNVTLEAMASGIPTVCADATGSRELVLSGETGYLAPPKDHNAFYEATHRLITQPDLRLQMGQAARNRALEYDWETVLAKIERYYDEILFPETVL